MTPTLDHARDVAASLALTSHTPWHVVNINGHISLVSDATIHLWFSEDILYTVEPENVYPNPKEETMHLRSIHCDAKTGEITYGTETCDDTADDMCYALLAQSTVLLNDCLNVVRMALGSTHGA